MTDDFKAILDAMKSLGLNRDTPFDAPLEKDFHAELEEKLKPKTEEPPPYPDYCGC